MSSSVVRGGGGSFHRLPVVLAVAVAVVAASLALTANAWALAVVVNTEADSLDGVCDAHCSIRDGVTEANASPTDDVVFVPDGHFSVDFGPIALTGNGETEVEGFNPRTSTIDAKHQSGIFVLSGAGTAEIKRVTLTGGETSQGGAILAQAGSVAEIEQVAITQNTATELGGGIYNLGTMEIEEALLNDNTAGVDGAANGGSGGGIYNAGAIEAENLTVTDNKATGGTSVAPRGGGIFQQGDDEASYENLTVSHNTADFEGLGIAGGLFVGSSNDTSLENTIVAHNQSAAAGSENCFFEVAISETNNLENGSGCGFSGPGDKQQVDPLLGPLQNNQGFTDTRALAPNSPALDSIDESQCPIKDQRTLSRPQGPACDIGAFEVEAEFRPDPPLKAGVSGTTAKAFQVGLSSRKSQRILRQRGVVVSVDCDRACNLSATGKVSIGSGASRTVRLRKATKKLTAAGRARLKLRVPRRALRSIRRAFAGGRKLTALIKVSGTDASGAVTSTRQKIRLTR